MSSLREQIHDRMNLKETDELLEIWQNNDRFEWSDDAFEVIKEILKERDVDIPEQNEPIYEHKEDEKQENYDFSDEELRIIDDENPPDFYDPLEVLKLNKWLMLGAKVSIAVSIVAGLVEFPYALDTASAYFREIAGWSFVSFFIALLGTTLAIGLQILTIYLPLIALARILRILMEMEFRSRKGTQPNSLVE